MIRPWPYTATSTVAMDTTTVTVIGTTIGSENPILRNASAPRNDDASQLSAKNTEDTSHPVNAMTTLFPITPYIALEITDAELPARGPAMERNAGKTHGNDPAMMTRIACQSSRPRRII